MEQEKVKILLKINGVGITLPEDATIAFTASDAGNNTLENTSNFNPRELVELLRIYPQLLKTFNSLYTLSHQALG